MFLKNRLWCHLNFKRTITINYFKMANSRFEYIREYEEATEKKLIPDTYLVVRIDGKQFHRFSKEHNYLKPNDKRGLDLMTTAAKHVMTEFFPEIIIAYGQSDEFSFVFHKKSNIYNRRQNKLLSIIVSSFSSAFTFNWMKHFGATSCTNEQALKYPPSFDSRCVLYPTNEDIIDYLRWRQVDCHINNIYNTTFYALTQEYCKWKKSDKSDAIDGYEIQSIDFNCPKLSPQEAENRLKKSVSREKKFDILHAIYKIDYDMELEQFKRGNLIIVDRSKIDNLEIKALKKKNEKKGTSFNHKQVPLLVLNQDFIIDEFWKHNLNILNPLG